MDGRYFVSYSRVDAEEFAQRLADALVAGPPSYPVWLDVRDARPGTDWDTQIRDAIQACPGVLLVMTADSVQDQSVCKLEWSWVLKHKKPVIPLRAVGSRHCSTPWPPPTASASSPPSVPLPKVATNRSSRHE